METKFIHCKNYYPINIEYVEKKYSAKYIGDFSIKQTSGNYTDYPLAIFYVKNPDTSKGHSHYFGIGFLDIIVLDGEVNYNKAYITRGDSAFENITGLQLANGNVLISSYGHDYVKERDSFIDGGRDYCRYSLSEGDQLVKVEMINGKFKIKKDVQ